MTDLAIKTRNATLGAGAAVSTRDDVARALWAALAESYKLLVKTQGAHWRVAGSTCRCLHRLTEEHYESLRSAIDALAERIRAHGEDGAAQHAPYGGLSTIEADDEEEDERAPAPDDLVDRLVAGHEAVIAAMREAVAPCLAAGEEATIDVLRRRMVWHDHAIWRLRSLII